MKMATDTRSHHPSDRGRIQLLQSLDFKQVIVQQYPNLTVELSDTEGVVFVGAATDIEKAETTLSNFATNLKESGSMWKLDRHKVQLLHAKETQKYVRDELARQNIKCHFTLDRNNEVVKLYALDSHAIGKAQTALEEYICTKTVSHADPFLVSVAEAMSLDYAGRFIQIKKADRTVLVFTRDIKNAVEDGRRKANDRSAELESKDEEEVTERLDEYVPYIHILKCLSFAERLKENLFNVKVRFEENGVVLKGYRAHVKKANDFLRKFVDTLKTSGPEWRLNSYKVQLLYTKESQEFLMQEILRQNIRCCFKFEADDGSVKLFACSDKDITNAQAFVERSICVMDVPLGDPFIESEAMNMSLDFSGKFLQIDEEDKVVFVFTSDVNSAVQTARNNLKDNYSRIKTLPVVNKINDKENNDNNTYGDSIEETDCNNDGLHFDGEARTNVAIAGQNANNELDNVEDEQDVHSSLAHVLSKDIHIEVTLGEFLFEMRSRDIGILEEKTGLSIVHELGIINMSGEAISDQTFDKVIDALEKMAASVSMRAVYFNGQHAVDFFITKSFERKQNQLKDKGCVIVASPVLPTSSGTNTATVVYNGIEINITNAPATELKAVDVVICPVNSSLTASSPVAEQLLYQGKNTVQQQCAATYMEYLSTNHRKPPIGYIAHTHGTGQLPYKWFNCIVLGDWYTNKDELQSKIVFGIRTILQNSNTANYMSVAIPLDVGEKIPALEYAGFCCDAIRNFCLQDNIIQKIHLCVTENRCLPNVTRLVQKKLGIAKEEKQKSNIEQFPNQTLAIYEKASYPIRVKVDVIVDELTHQQVDAIVCTTRTTLKLNYGAVSKAVLKAAGDDIQANLLRENPKGIGPGEVIKTSPGNLSCKLLFVGCLPAMSSGGYEVDGCLATFLRKTFALAHSHGITSLAFPAIGTGGLGYPCEMVAREMFRAVYLYADKCKVQNVRFVMHHADTYCIKIFKEFSRSFRAKMKHIAKDINEACHKISIQIGNFPGAIDILQGNREHKTNAICDMSDALILHTGPKKENDKDTLLKHDIQVKKLKEWPDHFIREVVFLNVKEDAEVDCVVTTKYRTAFKYAVNTLKSQVVTVDIRDFQTIDIVSAVSQILNIFSVMLNEKSYMERLHIVVRNNQMQHLLMNAYKQGVKDTGLFSKLKTLTSETLIPNALKPVPITWKPVIEKMSKWDATGVNVTVIASNDNVIQNVMSEFQSKMAELSDDETDSDVESDKDTTAYHEYEDGGGLDNMDIQETQEIYGKLTSKVSTNVTSRYPKEKLVEITDGIKKLGKGISTELVKGTIEFSMNYSRREDITDHFSSVFGDPLKDPDNGPFYVHAVEKRMYELLQANLKKDTKLMKIELQYDEKQGEVIVNADRTAYSLINDRIDTLKAYTSDSVEITNVEDKENKTNTAVETLYQEYPIIVAILRNMEIEIHGPSEALQSAKHRLKVLLGLVKPTGRARRSFAYEPLDEYSSLQSSLSDSSAIKIESMKSQHMSMLSFERSQYHNEQKRKNDKPKVMTFATPENLTVIVYKGSIIDIDVDCIVNAANERLVHAGGVAKIIARAAGKEFENESETYVQTYGNLKVTESMTTGAGNMKYKSVIHAVGPRWEQYEDKEMCKTDLLRTVRKCLKEADRTGNRSVGIPSISAGIFGMPKEVCAEQYVRGVCKFSSRGNIEHLNEIHFVDVNDDIIQTIQNVFSSSLVVTSVKDHEESYNSRR